MFSVCLGGCIEKGMDASMGGAKYNSTGFQAVGCADIADSFSALEEVVFKSKNYTLK